MTGIGAWSTNWPAASGGAVAGSRTTINDDSDEDDGDGDGDEDDDRDDDDELLRIARRGVDRVDVEYLPGCGAGCTGQPPDGCTV